MSIRTLIIRYSFFAAMATVANLLAQRLVLKLGTSTMYFAAAIAVGTLVGLVVKYILDMRWIFYDSSSGVRAHSEKFTLYTAMGLITTVIFWGFETAFWWLWQTDLMRECGAVIGLTIGYVVKYNLDKRFVFNDKRFGTPA